MHIQIVENRAGLEQGVRLLFLPEGRELEAEWPGLTGAQGFSGKAGRVRLVAGSRGMALAVGLGDAEKLDMDGFRAGRVFSPPDKTRVQVHHVIGGRIVPALVSPRHEDIRFTGTAA